MSYPALCDFDLDPHVTFHQWRVYKHLRLNLLTFHGAKPVKVSAVVHSLKIGKAAVIESLDWLVEHGYLIEHARDHVKATRVFTLVYSRPAPASSSAPRIPA